MNRVSIELWLWLVKELGEDFESVSGMRSLREEMVEEGTTIRQWLNDLAKRYPPIGRVVFDVRKKRILPSVVVSYNERAISPHVVHEQVLKDGDRLKIISAYAGG